jgi:glycosyltransferase involved in cell wall biosynthesis
MPTLDRAPWITAALDSILSQSGPPFEVIVVDGGSTDGTLNLVRGRAGVKLIEVPGSGVPGAHNAGLAAATGSVVAFAASDDLLEPGALQAHTAALEVEAGCGMSVGLTAFFADDPHARTRPGLAGSVRRARVLEAVAVRRSVYEVHGGFDESLGPSADLEWVSRLADRGVDVVDVESVVVRKRLHAGNVTYDRDLTRSEVLGAVRATLRRRATEDPEGRLASGGRDRGE